MDMSQRSQIYLIKQCLTDFRESLNLLMFVSTTVTLFSQAFVMVLYKFLERAVATHCYQQCMMLSVPKVCFPPPFVLVFSHRRVTHKKQTRREVHISCKKKEQSHH